jgi:ribosomal protein S18 acetylase RimI-like enzyme
MEFCPEPYKYRKTHISMKVLPLDSHSEPLFWQYVREDIPHYYFFILDMSHDRASTEILLALNGQNRIEGMIMTYKEKIVQLRGTTKAAKALLARLDVEKVEIQGLEEHKPLLLEKFKKVKTMLEITLMTLNQGEETLHMNHQPEPLSGRDAGEIASIMKEADPEWWGEVTAKGIAHEMNDYIWLGIRVDEHLVSIGGAASRQWGGNIGVVATRKDHRNKGYATSVVSALVEEILHTTDLALVHVENDNEPAVKTYTKVGFKPYKRYVVARTEGI